LRLGVAQRQAGEPAYRETLLEAARLAERLGATETLVAAALANNRGYFSEAGAVDSERVAVLEAACAELAGSDSGPLARLLALLASELTYGGDLPRRLELVHRAIAIARGVGDPTTLVGVINDAIPAIDVAETLAERVALGRGRRTDGSGDVRRCWGRPLRRPPCRGRFSQARFAEVAGEGWGRALSRRPRGWR